MKYLKIFSFMVCLFMFAGFVFLSLVSVDVGKATVENLEERYGVNFEFKCYMESFDLNSRVMKLSTGVGDIIVSRYHEGEKVVYTDNYLGVLYKKDIENVVSKEVSKNSSVFVDMEFSSFPKNTYGGMSLSKLLAHDDTYISLSILTEKLWEEKEIVNFIEKLFSGYGMKVEVCMLEGSYGDSSIFVDKKDFLENAKKKVFFASDLDGSLLYLNYE